MFYRASAGGGGNLSFSKYTLTRNVELSVEIQNGMYFTERQDA